MGGIRRLTKKKLHAGYCNNRPLCLATISHSAAQDSTFEDVWFRCGLRCQRVLLRYKGNYSCLGPLNGTLVALMTRCLRPTNVKKSVVGFGRL